MQHQGELGMAYKFHTPTGSMHSMQHQPAAICSPRPPLHAHLQPQHSSSFATATSFLLEQPGVQRTSQCLQCHAGLRDASGCSSADTVPCEKACPRHSKAPRISLLGPHLPRHSRVTARVADGQRPRAEQHLGQRRRVRQALQHAVHEARVAQVAQAGALWRTAIE